MTLKETKKTLMSLINESDNDIKGFNEYDRLSELLNKQSYYNLLEIIYHKFKIYWDANCDEELFNMPIREISIFFWAIQNGEKEVIN
ncbi:MAG: hypothetical protein ACFFG0_05575 [Candidatus Thorarchaeota archaeon]